MEGDWLNYKPGKDADRKLLISSIESGEREPEVIRRGEVPNFLTPEIRSIIEKYWISKTYGLPYGNKWAKNPAVIMDIIICLDTEEALIRKSRS